MFRFSNAIFERLWNRDVIDNVQVTVSERQGVGERGGYYEEAGALRDMVQNHLLQVLSLVAMEPPVSLDAEPIRAYLQRIYTMHGRTDDFRELDRRLFIVATELDSGRAVRFGERGHDHVPISTAVQASSALPGLYPPVRIGGRYYVDGALGTRRSSEAR